MHAIRAIEKLLEDQDVAARPIFWQCYKINELSNGKSEPYFEMDRDGFTLLAMGFTGKQALQTKGFEITSNGQPACRIGITFAPTFNPSR
jgi:phage regulator Rha-like protein